MENKVNNNGYVKWSIFTWIMGVFIFAMGVLISNVIANEDKNIRRYDEIKTLVIDYVIPLKEDMAELKTEVKNLCNANTKRLR